MNHQIRDYRPDDFKKVNQLWIDTGMGGSFRGDTSEIILTTLENGGHLRLMVHTGTGEIIGTYWLTNDHRRVYLHHFGIDPAHQGKGLSKFLLSDALNVAEKTGLQIKLEVHKNNFKALHLYKKYGFSYLGDYEVYIIREYGKKTKDQ